MKIIYLIVCWFIWRRRVSGSDYMITVNGDFEIMWWRIRSCSVLRYYSGICPEGLEESRKKSLSRLVYRQRFEPVTSLVRSRIANRDIATFGFTSITIVSFSGWGETESTWYVSHYLAIVPAPDDRWWLWSSWWNEDWQGKPKYSEKTCPSATVSSTIPTWPDLGANPGRRGGKPVTNRLSYGTVYPLQ
jgi:hypothetical protein